MLNLNDLQIFVHVVSHGGFSAASRALGIPKQTLSKRVGELERQTGTRLIQRTSRSFTVTELGEEILRHGTAMLIEAEAAEHAIAGRIAEPSGAVRITASVPTTQTILSSHLPLIAREFPKIRIVLEATDRMVDLVQEGFDIAIRDHFDPLPDSGLVQRRVKIEDIWLVAAAPYADAHKPPDAPKDLQHHHGLMISPEAKTWTLTGPEGATVEASPVPRYFANESTALLEAAMTGLGIACLPESMCRQAIATGSLCRVLPDWIAGSVTTTMLFPSKRGQLPSVRAVAAFLGKGISQPDRS